MLAAGAEYSRVEIDDTPIPSHADHTEQDEEDKEQSAKFNAFPG